LVTVFAALTFVTTSGAISRNEADVKIKASNFLMVFLLYEEINQQV